MRIANRPIPRSLRPIQQQLEAKQQALKQASTSRQAAVADPEAAAKEQTTSLFKQQFREAAADPQKFHELMSQVFGEGYDRQKAESFRQMALDGDFSFLPDIQFVDASTLGGANGAYNAQEGVVYINRDLDPTTAAQTFVEEAGHHLDTKLNKTDTAGDEGEMFRRIMGGEKLSQAQIAEIRAENDKGVINVNGKEVEVEFWNPFKKIGEAVSKAAKAVGNAVKKTAEKVGGAVKKAAEVVGGAVKKVATGAVNGVIEVGKGIVGAAKQVWDGATQGIGGFFSNLVQGKVGDAFMSLVRGADKVFFQAPQRLVGGVINGAQNVVNGVTDALGPIGKPFRWVTDRAFDIGRTAVDTGFGVARDVFRTAFEVPIGFAKDLGNSAKLLLQGDFKGAAKQFGEAFLNVPKRAIGGVADSVIRGLQGAASIVQTAIGLEPPGRSLSPAEKQYLQSIYGDSIDYDQVRVKPGGALNDKMAAHVVGNTIYMPAEYFNDDGTLTPAGLETLGHEAGHVWQNQNGGGDYIHKALLAQLESTLASGNRNGAYDWRQAFADGKSFEDMNPEEQASVMEDIGVALQNDGAVTADDWSEEGSLSDAELAFVLDAWDKVKAGQGAP